MRKKKKKNEKKLKLKPVVKVTLMQVTPLLTKRVPCLQRKLMFHSIMYRIFTMRICSQKKKNQHVSEKKLHKKKEYEKNKTKLKTAGKMYFLKASKISEYQVCPAKIRKTKNYKYKFTECNLLTNED